LNGAKALGLDAQIGSLEVGKSADITAIKLSDLDVLPVYDPASQLVYTHVGHRVSHVWVQGRCLMADRELLTIDEEALKTTARQWQQKIGGRS